MLSFTKFSLLLKIKFSYQSKVVHTYNIIIIVIAFWSEMQPHDIELYKKDEKHGLHACSYAHMKYLLTQTEIFMKDLETSSVFQSTGCH